MGIGFGHVMGGTIDISQGDIVVPRHVIRPALQGVKPFGGKDNR